MNLFCVVYKVMLNEKYGSYWIPLEIEEQDFNMILKKVTEDEKEFVNKWYKLSKTLEPHAYILQVWQHDNTSASFINCHLIECIFPGFVMPIYL